MDAARIDTMLAGLTVMYTAEGFAVRRITPKKHQSVPSFRRFADSLTKRPEGGRRGVVAITKHKGIVQTWSAQCGFTYGVVIFLPGCAAMGLGYSDVDASVASMRTHLHKYVLANNEEDDDPDTCVVCTEAPKALQCSHCFTSTCKECFVKTMLVREGGDGQYECPGCRRGTHILDIMDAMRGEAVFCSATTTRAILAAMKGLDLTETCLTILAIEPEIRLHALVISCDAAFTNLRKATRHAVNKLLERPGTMFLVGDPPVKCPCCDVLNHGNLGDGQAFEVTRQGVWRLKDQFDLMMVVATWLKSTAAV